MSAMPEHAIGSSERELVITRVFDAPRELVFKAWTECEHFARWWGPSRFTTPGCTIDLRPGGRLHYCMRAPDGQEFWGLGVYREIVPPERIVYTDMFADEHGDPVPPTHYGMSADWPAETLVTVTFAELDGKTRLTLRHTGAPAGRDRDMTGAGWNQSFDRLGEYLTGTKESG